MIETDEVKGVPLHPYLRRCAACRSVVELVDGRLPDFHLTEGAVCRGRLGDLGPSPLLALSNELEVAEGVKRFQLQQLKGSPS